VIQSLCHFFCGPPSFTTGDFTLFVMGNRRTLPANFRSPQPAKLCKYSVARTRSICAATPFEPELFEKYPEVTDRFPWFIDARPELCAAFHDHTKVGVGGRRLFSVLDESKLRRALRIMLDENEFHFGGN